MDELTMVTNTVTMSTAQRIQAEARVAATQSFVLSRTGIARTITVDGKTEEKLASWDTVGRSFGERMPLDTGLLPPGLLSYRQAGAYSQMVMQTPPGIATTCWGEREGGEHVVYQLALPWRVILGVYQGAVLIGARLFYSPSQVTHLRQPLYHANVPNLNCLGYSNQVAVGWLCLYPSDVRCYTIADKARYLVDRASGGEPFNNRNMSRTDGPRFYQKVYRKLAEAAGTTVDKYNFLWDPLQNEAMTEANGPDWVLDPDLWIPVRVNEIDDQAAHAFNGEPLSLGMAMYGRSKFYYSDVTEKPYDYIDRVGKLPEAMSDQLYASFNSAHSNPSPPHVFMETAFSVREGFIHPCLEIPGIEQDSIQCASCAGTFPKDDLQAIKMLTGTTSWWCQECLDEGGYWCESCDESVNEETALCTIESSDFYNHTLCGECMEREQDKKTASETLVAAEGVG